MDSKLFIVVDYENMWMKFCIRLMALWDAIAAEAEPGSSPHKAMH